MEFQADYVKVGLRRLGIASQFNGEELRAVDKTYARKNGNRVCGAAFEKNQKGLFDVQV